MWLWIDEFIGKGIDIWTVVKFFGLQSLTLIPISLPLGILFAALMTYGNLGETSELVAVKSSGISIARFTKPLFAFVVVLTVISFGFNNYVIPKAQLKATRMLYDISNKKPVVAIKAGTFYTQIPNHTIYISKKDADNKTIHNIKLYDHSSGRGNDKIIYAEKGKMYVTDDKRYLIFELENGWRYEDKAPKGKEEYEQIRLGFRYWKKVFDLSDFKMPQTDESYFKSLRAVMNAVEIARQIDTSEVNLKRVITSNKEQMRASLSILAWDTLKQKGNIPQSTSTTKKWHYFDSDSLQRIATSNAEISIRSAKSLSELSKHNYRLQKLNLAQHKTEFHKRFTIPFTCILLFIIGAALGSIIRKGGLGMPFIVAVSFFILYYLLNTVGEKISTEMVVPAALGMWMPCIILGVIGAILMHLANTDSASMKTESYLKPFRFLASKFTPKKNN